MANLEEELQMYKAASAITSDIFFRYSFESDTMNIYGGPAYLSQYGSVTNNFVENIRNKNGYWAGNAAAVKFAEAVDKGFPEFFDEEVQVTQSHGETCWYRSVGKIAYDDNWKQIGVIGKLTNISQYKEDRSSLGDKTTGALDRKNFSSAVEGICRENQGKEGAMLVLVINNLDELCAGDSLKKDSIVTYTIQCIRRIFPNDIIYGRLRNNEIGIFYHGDNVEREFTGKLDELKNSITSIDINNISYLVTINAGLAVDKMMGDAYIFLDRANIALLMSKRTSANNIETFSDNFDNKKSANTVVDTSIIENALNILSETGNISKSVYDLLMQVGEHYKLDCITVQEYDEKKDKTYPGLQWLKPDNYTVKAKMARLPFDNISPFDWGEDEIFVIDKLSDYDGDNFIINRMKNIETKAVVICRYAEKNGRGGFVSFEKHERETSWTKEEITTFRLTSKFITAYLKNMESYFKLLEKQEFDKKHDLVTGLIKFEEFKDKCLEYVNGSNDKQMAVIAFGFMNFEKVNKIYGHTVGDEVLKAFANEYNKIEDRFIYGCRTNADNFIALVNQFDSRGNKLSASIIERMNESFAGICKEKCPEANLTVNAGIVILPEHIDNIEGVIMKAIEARDNAREDDMTCVFAV